MVSREPAAGRLKPFVARLWASSGEAQADGVRRERTLPTGRMHIVFRLGDSPLRLFANGSDAEAYSVGTSAIGGARAESYVKAVAHPGLTVGIELHAGASEFLTGLPASELAHRHTRLDDVWPRAFVEECRERLAAAANDDERLDIAEAMLLRRLPQVGGLDPMVANAVFRLGGAASVGDLVAASGCSHRKFAAAFDHAVGLTPKVYGRVARFQRALRIYGSKPASWADVAYAAGYADQAHLVREFGAIAGVSPGEYRRRAPTYPNHVPISGGQG